MDSTIGLTGLSGLSGMRDGAGGADAGSSSSLDFSVTDNSQYLWLLLEEWVM